MADRSRYRRRADSPPDDCVARSDCGHSALIHLSISHTTLHCGRMHLRRRIGMSLRGGCRAMHHPLARKLRKRHTRRRMRPESSGVGIFMNMKVGLAVLSVLLAAGLLAACSPVRLLNALTPSYIQPFRRYPVRIRRTPRARRLLAHARLASLAGRCECGRPGGRVLYGGSWQSGERKDYLFVGEALASRVLLPSYPTTGRIRRLPFPVSSTMRRRRWRGHASMQLRSAAIHVACF